MDVKIGENIMSKREYNIRVPFTGYFDITVEAGSESEAIDEMHNQVPVSLDEILDSTDYCEWGICEKVVDGNFFCGLQNEIEIEIGELVDDEY